MRHIRKTKPAAAVIIDPVAPRHIAAWRVCGIAQDRFGRLLAYVYVTDVMLNEELLRRGYAETLTIPPNDSESGRFERIEDEARKAGVGLWGSCT